MKNFTLLLIVVVLFAGGCGSERANTKDTMRAYELFNEALEYNLQELNSLALPLYDSAIMLAPDKAEFYTNRGLTRYELSDTAAALKDYFKAVELDSLDATIYMNIGSLFSDRGDYETGLRYANKALLLGDTYVYYNIGYCQYMLEDYEKAADSFLTLLEKHNNYWTEHAFYYLGNSYAYLGQIDNAQRCWNKANELAGYDIKEEFDEQVNSAFTGK